MDRSSGVIWWLVGVTEQVSSSSGIIVIVIIESRRVWYWLMFLVLAICRFCLLVRLFFAVVAMIAMCLVNCAINVLCDSLMGSCNSDFCNWASSMVCCSCDLALINSCSLSRALRDYNSSFASNFARSALRWVMPDDSELSFIILFLLVSSYVLYSYGLGVAAAVGATPVVVQGVSVVL